MTWENYGEWEIDHITPIRYPGADGGPPTLEEVEHRLHYLNTQALWKADNRRKGNRYVGKPPPLIQADLKLTDQDIDDILLNLGI